MFRTVPNAFRSASYFAWLTFLFGWHHCCLASLPPIFIDKQMMPNKKWGHSGEGEMSKNDIAWGQVKSTGMPPNVKVKNVG